ncbi:hypothetical protein DY000_02023911 [Brassica cretica]|uniref:Retrotransposon gag domain-containing protein n=1 Tax=Brassica cretica TaxID=69181 RepID=A0ABQ7EJG5_BRACR|nr:hypothetical protein DY000_02023911 [Brassica cretica]
MANSFCPHCVVVLEMALWGAVIPDLIVVAEMNDFDLIREWYDRVSQDPFKGLPHQDPRNHIEELEDLVSRSEQNEVSEYHMLCKIFPYFISGDAFRWFSQLQPRSLTSRDDIERAFLYKFLDDAEATREKEKNDKWDRFLASSDEEYMIPIQLLDDIMAKRDEQHVSRELRRVEEAGTEDTTSTSTDGRTSTSTDGRTSTSTDGTTSTSTDGTTATSINGTTSTSIDSTTSMSTNGTTSMSIDDVEKEVTMEDFLELEEWLGDMDQNSENKLDDYQHTSRGDLETSPKASIDRHQPDEIDREPADSIDLHPHSIIDRHTPEIVNRHPSLEELLGYIVELEPKLLREGCDLEMKSIRAQQKQHRSTPTRYHRTTAQMQYRTTSKKPVSIDTTTSPSIDTGRISEQKEFDVCGNLFDGETTTRSNKSGGKKRGNWKKRKRTKGGSQLSLIPYFSNGVRKSRVHSRCFSQPFAKLRALLIAEMIDKGVESMEEAFTQE